MDTCVCVREKGLEVSFLIMQSQCKGCIEIIIPSDNTLKCHQKKYLWYKATRNYFLKNKQTKTNLYFPKVMGAVLLEITETLLSKIAWLSRKRRSPKVSFKN